MMSEVYLGEKCYDIRSECREKMLGYQGQIQRGVFEEYLKN